MLTILLGVVFYGDPISSYVIIGVSLFLSGVLIVNLPGRKQKN